MKVPEVTGETGENAAGAGEVYVLPSSFGQERFWALDRLNPGNPAWNVPVRFRLEGELEPLQLERAFNEIIRRHEVLRTTFRESEGSPAQVIAPTLTLALPVVDLRHLAKPERDAEVDRLSFEEARRRFDLATGALLRIGLLWIADREHVLLVTPHHSIADYISIGLLADEFGTLYESYARGVPATLPEPPIQYGDFAIWQREQAESDQVRSELAYWQTQLRDLAPLDFPTDQPRPAFPTYDATITSMLLPTSLTDAIRDIGMRHGATFFNTMLAALDVLLYQYTGQTDIGVATQVAGRPSVDLEKLIGLFVNTVVLRANLAGNPAFADLLEQVQRVGAEAIERPNVRFEQILKALRPVDYPSHHTLFRINFICQRDPVKPLEFAGIKLTVIPSKSQGALYDLNVFLVLRNEGWRLACEYNTDLFAAESITLLLENYRKLLEALAANPDRRIAELPEPRLPPPPISSTPAPPEHEPTALTTDVRPIVAQRIIDSPKPIAAAGAIADPADDYAFDLTLEQQRFWSIEQLMPGNPALNMQAALLLRGPLKIEVLQRSLDEVIRRHEILRTTFRALNGRTMQLIHPSSAVRLRMLDIPQAAETDRAQDAPRILREEALLPFDLAQGPLIRASLLRFAPDDHLLMITMPHIICDGWSNGVLLRELTALYQAYAGNLPSPLPEPSIQYADFACWQTEWLASIDFEDDRAFWKHKLAGRLPLLDLPTDRPPTAGMIAEADTETLEIPRELVDRLKEFCKREEITLFMFFLAAFKALLSRYTGQEDILVGSPVAGRTPETESVIGPFSYPICLRTDLSGDPAVRELLHRVREVAVDALAHKDLPFSRLLEDLQIEQLQGRNSPFQFYFLHQTAFIQPTQTGDLAWTPLTWISPGTSFDLHLATLERPDGIVARLEYKPAMFDAATIQRMLRHFRAIVEAFVATPDRPLSQLPILGADELRRTALEAIEGVDGEFKDLVELFAQQARQTPNAIAAIGAGGQITYAELEARVKQLAVRLAELDLGPKRIIGVCCNFSTDLPVGALAALKVGGAYVWFEAQALNDPAVARLVKNHVKVVVADEKARPAFKQKGLRILSFADVGSSNPSLERTRPVTIGAADLACVAFATARDGKRVALEITHGALAARVRANVLACDFRASDRIRLTRSSPTIETVLAALIAGSRVVLDLEPSQDSDAREIAESGCNVALVAGRPWQRRILRDHTNGHPPCSAMRLVVTQGSPPDATEGSVLTKDGTAWRSIFGGAETGGAVAIYQTPLPNAAQSAHSLAVIEKALPGFSLRLYDRNLRREPIGIPGEICVAGAGVALDYFDEPELTRAEFAVAPTGERVFRTGQLGRYRPDGSIEFLGRPDRHLNLHGFRLPVIDLEAALSRHEAVADLCVVPARTPSGEQRPVVYVVVKTEVAGPPTADRDFHLRRRLCALATDHCPHYPKILAVTIVKKLDCDDEGEVIQTRLPVPDPESYELGTIVAPRNSLEAQLVELWEESLGIKRLGINESFFDLGGNSVIAARLFARINSIWGRNLPLSTLFETPTISELAELLRSKPKTTLSSSLVPIRPRGTRPPLFIISGIGGNVVRFHALSRYLSADQPVYALQPPGLDGQSPYLTRVEDMAAHYLREMRALQATGPYYLAGYSFGGIVTFEMARQLIADGDKLALLAMLDAPEWQYECRRVKKAPFRVKLQRYRYILTTLIAQPQRFEYLGNRVRQRATKMFYRFYKILGWRFPQNVGSIQDVNIYAAGQYVPRPCASRLTIFRSRPTFKTSVDDDTIGWAPYALAGVDSYEIPGTHDDITSEPNVRAVAEKLQSCLDQAHRNAPRGDDHVPPPPGASSPDRPAPRFH
jgi:non-ribosomal peptide synthetase component F/thioesterase domain-containing protein